jgi:hypothetical protein
MPLAFNSVNAFTGMFRVSSLPLPSNVLESLYWAVAEMKTKVVSRLKKMVRMMNVFTDERRLS